MAETGVNIQTAATEPAQVTADGVTVRQHSLKEQIEADRYLRSQTAAAATGKIGGLRFNRTRPPGGGGL